MFSSTASLSYWWFKWKIDYAPSELGIHLLPGSLARNNGQTMNIITDEYLKTGRDQAKERKIRIITQTRRWKMCCSLRRWNSCKWGFAHIRINLQDRVLYIHLVFIATLRKKHLKQFIKKQFSPEKKTWKMSISVKDQIHLKMCKKTPMLYKVFILKIFSSFKNSFFIIRFGEEHLVGLFFVLFVLFGACLVVCLVGFWGGVHLFSRKKVLL